MSDTEQAELQQLRTEVHLLTERVATLERRGRGEASSDDIERLLVHVRDAEQRVPVTAEDDLTVGLPLSHARRAFTAAAIDAALVTKRVFRRRDPLTGVIVLRTVPGEPDLLDIETFLRQHRAGQDAPRGYASFATLREVFNKNRVATDADRLRRQGKIVIGTLQTGHPGRPPRAVALAGEPLPTHVDGLPVKWET